MHGSRACTSITVAWITFATITQSISGGARTGSRARTTRKAPQVTDAAYGRRSLAGFRAGSPPTHPGWLVPLSTG